MTAPGDATFVWGEQVQNAIVRGFPCRVYTQTRRDLSELFLDARRWSDRTALVHGDRRLTFAELEASVRATAAHLVELGVGRGGRVMLLAPNSIEWVVTMWATLFAGGVAVLGNFWWSA